MIQQIALGLTITAIVFPTILAVLYNYESSRNPWQAPNL